MNSEELKSKIKEKYRSLSRFAALAGMSYSRLFEIITRGSGPAFDQVVEKVTKISNAPTSSEVTPEHIKQVREALEAYKGGERGFCRDNGFNLTWIKQFLAGHVRFADGLRADRLLKTLNLKPLTDGPTHDKHTQVENSVLPKPARRL